MEHSLDIRGHEAWFAAFTEKYRREEAGRLDGDVRPIDIKITHSAAVLAHARRLVREEQPQPLLARACLLASLYHDVARFPQYARWHTFKDSLSANHGLLGIKTLKTHARLAEETFEVRALVLASVGMHNRFRVPAGLSADRRFVVDVVRDADKLDIFRVMAGHLSGPGPYSDTVILSVSEAPHQWSPKVLDDALAGRVAAYADLTSVNDFRLLLGTWIYDLRFAGTRSALAASGLLPRVLEGLPDVATVQQARQVLLARLEHLA